MTTNACHFADVTLLITHYNRSASLKRLLTRFDDLGCSFGAIVVSDDGSRAEHQTVLEEASEQYGFQLITTPKNGGLGHNINKGQAAVKTPYTLYVQEDFVPKPAFVPNFQEALNLMNQDAGLDIVRFYAYFAYPYLKPYAGKFAEMVFKPALWNANHLKFYYYSDHPHLRRQSFTGKFGRYAEGINVDKTEFNMCLSFIKNGGRGLFFTDFTTLFDQMNSSAEPSTATFRSDWNYGKLSYTVLRRVYLVYRFLKNTTQLSLFDPARYRSLSADAAAQR